MHSTESVEHIFSILRQLKRDFTYVDMLYLELKLRLLLLGAFNDITTQAPLNETASGYYHSYFMASDIDLYPLKKWPNDLEIQAASLAAYHKVEQLLGTLGIDAASMLKMYKPPDPPKRCKDTPLLSPIVNQPPRMMAELMALYAPVSMMDKQNKEMEACEMALIASSMHETMKM